MSRRLITLSEFEEMPLSDIESKVSKQGVRLLQKINRRHGVKIFQLLYDRIKATQFVGFVKVLGYTIQVVPKFLEADKPANLHFLLQLLKYTKKIKVKEQDLGEIGKLKDDFFEILIYIFAKNLRDLLQRDFKKTYVEFEDNTSFLKGKLLIREQIKRNSINEASFCCRYEEFTENNLMNQLFKYVATLLMRVSGSVSNKKLLEDILIYLCDVNHVPMTSSDIDRIHFTRLNCAYEPLVNLCRLFLENMSIQFSFSRLETFVFMFDMNRLFEEFVFEFIKRNRLKIAINGNDSIAYVKDQLYLGKLFGEFRMRVDILLKTASGRNILLDTKYKVLDSDLTHDGLSEKDFYQMFAYSNSQPQKYKNIRHFSLHTKSS